MRWTLVVVAVLLVTIGCTSRSAMQEWKRKAGSIAIGTPRSEVEAVLPPASAVVDPRSGQVPGQLTYWVDGNTLVRVWVDKNDVLAKPITVEEKKRPEETNK